MSDQPAFELLHEGLRRQLWKMKWPQLHQLQCDAISHILTKSSHVVLSAATAAGKTEAAFLPILSAIADTAETGLRVVYVGPLKALINDQFSRVEELCTGLDIPVHRWHGDIDGGRKKKFIDKPGGVLLITPESLESLFVNRSRHLKSLFAPLQFIVIDELHAFLGNERGLHLRSLIGRVSALTEVPLRMVGLSATLGDRDLVKRYISPDASDAVTWIEGSSGETEIRIKLHAYLKASKAELFAAAAHAGDTTEAEEKVLSQMATDIVRHCRGQTNLIFADSRNTVEIVGERCIGVAKADGLADAFLVHHGSLTAGDRHEAEIVMKQASKSGRAATTFCTSTLEMGIDIGDVKMVGQIGDPSSVAGLKQRVGRSGRRPGTTRVLRTYLECEHINDKSSLFDRLHLPLVQTIAVTQLLLSHWVEPPTASTFDLSTLTHQIISLIAETGGRRVAEIYQTLCQRGVFREVDEKTFTALLRQLGRTDVIEQTPQGELILGLIGENLRKDKGFYAAFPSSDALAVSHDGRRVGSVDSAPMPDQHIILAGRRWRVTDVDQQQRTVYVVPTFGRGPTPFGGSKVVLHPRVVLEMRSVLSGTNNYPYLNKVAVDLLANARKTAALGDLCTKRLVVVDTNETAVMTWAGTRTTDTLRAMLLATGLIVSGERIAIVVKLSLEKTTDLLAKLAAHPPTRSQILENLIGPPPAKYDELLDAPLRHESLERCWLDLPGAVEILSSSAATGEGSAGS